MFTFLLRLLVTMSILVTYENLVLVCSRKLIVVQDRREEGCGNRDYEYKKRRKWNMKGKQETYNVKTKM